jgi:hypothetical protein
VWVRMKIERKKCPYCVREKDNQHVTMSRLYVKVKKYKRWKWIEVGWICPNCFFVIIDESIRKSGFKYYALKVKKEVVPQSTTTTYSLETWIKDLIDMRLKNIRMILNSPQEVKSSLVKEIQILLKHAKEDIEKLRTLDPQAAVEYEAQYKALENEAQKY